jgi:hypothetical protein
MKWFRRVPKPCYCTSPTGYWCTREDRHTVHEATGGEGRLYSRWTGDFPSEDDVLETFATSHGFLKAVSQAGDELSAADHNDLIRGFG